MTVNVKICGLKDPDNLCAAVDAGARYVGFVFYPPSPRCVDSDIAANLSRALPTGVRAVGLFVSPDDALLEEITGKVPLDMIQLHGDETPARVADIKARFALPVMKAIRVADADDLADVADYEAAADWLLFDAKIDGEHGGTGHSFDWSLLAGRRFTRPWMLSGGLTAENVGEALTALSPDAVDISSGVESARGQKDAAKIKAFIEAVKQA